MINESSIKNNIELEMLRGCMVEEYFYDYKDNKIYKSDFWYQAHDVSIEVSGEINDNLIEKSFTRIHNNEECGKSKVIFSATTNTDKTQYNKLSFSIETKIIYNKDNKEIQGIRTNKFNIDVNEDNWIYLIVLRDGSTLPIIIVTHNRVGFLGIDDINIKDYAFRSSKEGFFNSYYTPYEYELREICAYKNSKINENPGERIIRKLNFSEELSTDASMYENSDNIKVKIDNGDKSVYFHDLFIANYKDDYNISINNFTAYNHIINEIGLDTIRKDENLVSGILIDTISGDSIKNTKNHDFSIDNFGTYHCMGAGAYGINSEKIKESLCYYQIKDIDNPNNEIYYINTDDDIVDFTIGVGHIDKDILEIIQIFKDGKTTYVIYSTNHSEEISINFNPNIDVSFEYMSYIRGNNRHIRSGKNKSILKINDYKIKYDKNGDIIDCDFYFGKNIKLCYNAFGVPKYL